MANLVDYLNWRGDLTFSQCRFNEIDGLILSNLAYVAFDNILPSPWEQEGITLQNASKLFWAEQEEKKILQEFSLIKMAPFVMRRMAASRRFGSLHLMCYQNSINQEEESQFSALCIQMEEGKTFVAFRGTDDTIIGWKENFRMCFETVPAQKKAMDYLNYISQRCPGKLWLGGHSKGGNLAVYAATSVKPDIQNRIQGIYNYDGPGFSKTMINSNGYQRIAHRIRKFVPDSSIIGMLLEHDENFTIVSSTERGFMQHDPISWRVLGKHFVTIPERGEESRRMDRKIHDWVYSLSLEERKKLVTDVFQAMEDSDVQTLNDFGDNKWRAKLWQIQKRIRNNPECYQLLKNAGRQMREEFGISLFPVKKFSQRKKKGENH